MQHIHHLLGDPASFLDKIFHHLNQAEIDVSAFLMDHICYRVETETEYQTKKAALSEIGELLTESIINRRPIATFKLSTPLIYQNREIYLIELPSPKPGSTYSAGYEHVEFVIDISLADFRNKYAHLEFDTKGFQKAVNPDLRLTWNDLSVKFHENDLEYVIKYLD